MLRTKPLSAAALAVKLSFISIAISHSAAANPANNQAVEVIQVYGNQGASRSATKLDLTVYETPQTVTVVSRPQMDDFALRSVNDLLAYTPGVTVEKVETDRIYYTARGFDVVNFQYDGIGVPFSAGLSHGNPDTAVFERVEVIKGAAGLVTGLANPSATVNYLRKRPSEQLSGYASLSAGSDSRLRFEGDVSGSLGANLNGRAVVVKERADSYLDRKEDDNSLLYLVAEYVFSEHTAITLGHSYNLNKVDGSLSGALPLFYSDGSPTDFDVATSTAPEWAYRDVKNSQTFAELRHQLSDNWSLNALLSENKVVQDSAVMYVYGAPDKQTGLGMIGLPNQYDLDETQRIADLYLSGSYSLFGRQHELMLGVNYAHIELFGQSFYDNEFSDSALGADWAAGKTQVGDFDASDPYSSGHQDKQIHRSVYLATRLHLSDAFSLLLGARNMSVAQHGYSYGTDASSDATETVPYLGGLYELNENMALYASYSEVFTPQSFVDPDFQALGVAKGNNAEIGAKFNLNNNATATLALFRADLKNVGEFAAVNNGVNTYHGLDYQSDGAELELVGSIGDAFNISFGYTWLNSVEGNDGQQVRTYVPRNMAKLSGVYYPSSLPALSLGASLKWQDDIYIEPQPALRREQPGYALIDLFVRYEASDNLSLALNASNMTDKKHLASLYWDQAFYGAPRQVQATLTWRY
ncbi:TonB-dependent siderophore receptor [Bowmanella denitrificans]|uniref:TonB-dependent siderophore receptor n=1 Tax=Bowmanella denitrificans TaxID=366582 RepID=UPI000C99F06B|nr:TonB-dependent siderophore receptor [Bowmanella denitrificans]